ncbi:ABC transporter G family member 37 [Hordeum vulgare]|nr:ABC transporter G family member 37 [Hordeum vulgare]
MILMVEGSSHDITHLKFHLLCFEEMFDLTINFAKSEVMVLGYSDEEKLSIANRLNYRVGTFPIIYLGIPISDSRILEKDLRPSVTKLQLRVEFIIDSKMAPGAWMDTIQDQGAEEAQTIRWDVSSVYGP